MEKDKISLRPGMNRLTKINSYLTFNGNCREAMTFYKESLGGELMLQSVEGSPRADKMPEEMKSCILHSTLTTEGFVLMGSDMVAETGLVKGNAVTLMLDCVGEAEVVRCFGNLSDGGQVNHPLEITFWGALFGDLTDKFGNNWILNCDKKISGNEKE